MTVYNLQEIIDGPSIEMKYDNTDTVMEEVLQEIGMHGMYDIDSFNKQIGGLTTKRKVDVMYDNPPDQRGWECDYVNVDVISYCGKVFAVVFTYQEHRDSDVYITSEAHCFNALMYVLLHAKKFTTTPLTSEIDFGTVVLGQTGNVPFVNEENEDVS